MVTYGSQRLCPLRKLCKNTGYMPLSKVRISNFIAELNMLGLLIAKKVYRGRYGRIRLVSPDVPREKVLPILAEG